MNHELMTLSYAKDSLAPVMSEETLDFHYSKHHQAYVTKLNELIEDTQFADMQLEEIIKHSDWAIYNNAAQIWNHNLFWNSFSAPQEDSAPTGRLADMIETSFWSFETMKSEFKNRSLGQFGSGWVWLVHNGGMLEIYSTPNAQNPLTMGWTALLWCDVWEHSYYIDYRNDRGTFIDNFWKIIDWEKVAERLV